MNRASCCEQFFEGLCYLKAWRYADSMRRVRSGFSLLEIVISIFVLGLVLSVGALTFQSTISRERGKGLSHTLAAELRAARATAMQSEKFVAVCIPNGGSNNPFSRSFAIRGGYDRGELIRTINFDNDLAATIYTGRWPGDNLETFDELPRWIGEADDEFRLVFRPDGTALSEDLAEKDGKYHFVVAANMDASGDRLTRVTSPTTIWVSKAGTIGVMESVLPGGTLPESTSLPTVAELAPPKPPTNSGEPVISAVDFLPIDVEGLEDVGLGQTAVQIHPQQKRPGMGQNGIEYGLSTFRFRATDSDGGPLTFSIEVAADKGEPGNFSYQESASALGPTTGGQMNFVQAEDGEWVWESVISWRPPPGAPMGTVYDFTLVVEDPEGNKTELASGADLMPRMALLKPENIVYETNQHQLVMTNLDGTSHRKLTLDEEDESKPFFSSDGTRLYSFYEDPDELSIITRNADGTNRKRLRKFPLSFFRKITFDPFNSYAAYLTGSSETVEVRFEVLKSKQVQIDVGSSSDSSTSTTTTSTTSTSTTSTTSTTSDSDTTETVTVYYLEEGSTTININSLEVMHLNSGKKVGISNHAEPNFKWYGTPRFGLAYTEKEIYDEDDKVDPPAQDPRAVAQGKAENLPRYIPSPGHQVIRKEVVIRGYPPKPEGASLPALSDGHQAEVFNLARPRYYLEQKTTAPCLTFHDSTGALPTTTICGTPIKSPSWSSDGREVLYAKENGDQVDICQRQVLNDKLDLLELGPEKVIFTEKGVKNPLLSSGGDYAFFLRGGDIYRMGIRTGGKPINLTKDLGSKVLSYVLSP